MSRPRLLPVPLTHLPGDLVTGRTAGGIVAREERIPLWADLLHSRGWRGSLRSLPIPTAHEDLKRGGHLPDWHLLDTAGLAAADLATVLPTLADRMRGLGRRVLLAGADGGPGADQVPGAGEDAGTDEDSGAGDDPGVGEDRGAAEAESVDDSSWWARLEPMDGRSCQWVVALDPFWAARVGEVAERLRPERVSLLLPFPARDPRLCDVLLARATRSLPARGVERSYCYTSALTPFAAWAVIDALVAAHKSAYRAGRPPVVLSPPVRDARGAGMLAAAYSWALPTLLPPPAEKGGAVRIPPESGPVEGVFGARWLCLWDLE
ncbi:hypothetical protein [Streptomyces sp. NPDC050164]|uniref:hypothetical protein n=1 Tax=Streptomyces sp. NPDC050164 TaxID=3365605 RepID=UPI0037B67303